MNTMVAPQICNKALAKGDLHDFAVILLMAQWDCCLASLLLIVIRSAPNCNELKHNETKRNERRHRYIRCEGWLRRDEGVCVIFDDEIWRERESRRVDCAHFLEVVQK
jgi:hypothetical protein